MFMFHLSFVGFECFQHKVRSPSVASGRGRMEIGLAVQLQNGSDTQQTDTKNWRKISMPGCMLYLLWKGRPDKSISCVCGLADLQTEMSVAFEMERPDREANACGMLRETVSSRERKCRGLLCPVRPRAPGERMIDFGRVRSTHEEVLLIICCCCFSVCSSKILRLLPKGCLIVLPRGVGRSLCTNRANDFEPH